MKGIIDLHTHSTASDGTLSPEELVLEAKRKGLAALALTDHDTTEGLPRAAKKAQEVGLNFVPGVEISVKFEGPGHCHLLGYFIDYEDQGLKEVLGRLHEARQSRNRLMVQKLQELGVPISLEELEAVAQGGEIGRPHMAKILVKKGIVRDFDEAFEKFLGKGKPAYVPKARLSPEEAISAISQAGGLTSLAHPIYLGLSKEETRAYVAKLKEMGLSALEAYYTDHDEGYTRFCLELAEEFGLLVTGGSDFHGENKPEIELGRGKGNLVVPFEVYERLYAFWRNRT